MHFVEGCQSFINEEKSSVHTPQSLLDPEEAFQAGMRREGPHMKIVDPLSILVLFSTVARTLSRWNSINVLKVQDSLPPKPERPGHSIQPEDLILIHNFQRKKNLEPRWKGPEQVLLVMQTAVKVARFSDYTVPGAARYDLRPRLRTIESKGKKD
ncbi:uncharacterized protein LOC144824745 [Lissotriton helveticus]